MVKSYKNNPLPTGIGRLLANYSLHKDDIADQILGKNTIKVHELLLQCFSLFGL